MIWRLKYVSLLALMTNSELISQLKAERYDIAVAAAYETDGCAYGLAHVLGIPSTVSYVATAYMDDVFHRLGIPTPPSFTTSIFVNKAVGDQPGLQERAGNFLTLLHPHRMTAAQEVFNRLYGPGFPSLEELSSKTSYFFVNTNEVIDLNKPISAKIKFMGGIAMKKPKTPLNDEMEQLVAEGKAGVILLSFGTLLHTSKVPRATKLELVSALRRFPDYTVLWKYDEYSEEEEELFSTAPNIKRMKWLPQVDLLNDARVKVFITHTGQNSYLEATHAGVPIIAIPVLVDQFYNAGCAVKLGVGIALDKSRLTEGALISALRAILGDGGSATTYQEQAKEVSRALAGRPEKPEKTFVDYVEYAAAFPKLGPHFLQMASAGMPFWKYYCLDMVALAAVAVLGLCLFMWTIRCCVVRCFERERSTDGRIKSKKKTSYK